MKTRFISMFLVLLFVFTCATAFSSCGAKATYTVGICQLVPHDALDAATNGFKQALIDEFGDQVKFDVQNAQGDSVTCTTIVNSFVAKSYNLIMANATPALQAASNATETIPVLGTSVTEYGVALQINNFNGTVGGNVSGTSDLAPLDQQAAMVTEWFPNAQTVGILYCSAEANSQYQVNAVKSYLETAGLTVNTFSFTDTNDVASVTNTACASSDVIYIPTDNACATSKQTIGEIVVREKVPVIAGEEGLCSACGVATLSISYYDLGYKTGKMAAKILKGEADISTMPIEYAQPTKKYNATLCTEYGLTPPADYVAID